MSTTDIVAAHLPSETAIFGWIEEIFGHGVRRPGYPADVWAEHWIEDKFREFGLENVHREPVPFRKWEPGRSHARVTTVTGETRELAHFPVPYAESTRDLDVELVAYDRNDPSAVAGNAALYTITLLTNPATGFAAAGSAPSDMTGRIIDDDAASLANGTHTVPFGIEFQEVMAPAIDAGAAAFVGTLDNPGNTYEYYVPYGPANVRIPGVYVNGTDGAWLRAQLARGPVRLHLSVESYVSDATTHNIVGELAGADDEIVIVGSHHDGPWASAVEDGSGIALVLAQAHYWSRRSAAERPHRLRFILQGAHMWGGAGLFAYIESHRNELDNVVLELHLEHAALETTRDADGNVVPTDIPVPRWFFTSRHASLERAVSDALTAERLTRSMLMPPDAFGAAPPTDGQGYHIAGVPIVNFLAAPWYLFDSVDTPDKIDRANLLALTRAAVRIVEFTGRTTAAKLRAEPGTP